MGDEYIHSDSGQPSGKIKWIITVIVISMIAIAGLYYFLNKRTDEVNKILFQNVKCYTLCPTELINNETSSKRVIVDGCFPACDNKYRNTLSKNDLRLGNVDKIEELLSDVMACYTIMFQDPNFDYKKCFDNVFQKYNYIANVSDMKPIEYTKYSFTY